MRKIPQKAVFALTVALALTPFASAASDIASTTTEVSIVSTPPPDISTGLWENDTRARLFAERQEVTLSHPLSVDISRPGKSDADDPNLSPVTIPAATIVDSYYLHFDPVGSPTSRDTVTGTITFNRPIIGLMAIDTTMKAADAAIGLAGETYSDGSLDFVQEDDNDILTLGADSRTVTFTFHATTGTDDLRIITLVPEPRAVVLSLVGFLIIPLRRPARISR